MKKRILFLVVLTIMTLKTYAQISNGCDCIKPNQVLADNKDNLDKVSLQEPIYGFGPTQAKSYADAKAHCIEYVYGKTPNKTNSMLLMVYQNHAGELLFTNSLENDGYFYGKTKNSDVSKYLLPDGVEHKCGISNEFYINKNFITKTFPDLVDFYITSPTMICINPYVEKSKNKNDIELYKDAADELSRLLAKADYNFDNVLVDHYPAPESEKRDSSYDFCTNTKILMTTGNAYFDKIAYLQRIPDLQNLKIIYFIDTIKIRTLQSGYKVVNIKIQSYKADTKNKLIDYSIIDTCSSAISDDKSAVKEIIRTGFNKKTKMPFVMYGPQTFEFTNLDAMVFQLIDRIYSLLTNGEPIKINICTSCFDYGLIQKMRDCNCFDKVQLNSWGALNGGISGREITGKYFQSKSGMTINELIEFNLLPQKLQGKVEVIGFGNEILIRPSL